ncbi:MAG: hypothetical protein KAX78_05190 [Phycisphaerae bacterium]|nr:hypothetical protein [Phycisphaerae bacterium]
MGTCRWILCGVVVITFGCESAQVQTDAQAPPGRLTAEYFRKKYGEWIEVPWDTPPADDPQADTLPRIKLEDNKPGDPVWRTRDEKSMVGAAVNLTDAQKQRIEQLYEQEEASVADWDTKYKGRLDELRVRINRMWDERNWLNHQRQKIRFTHQAHRRGVLTRRQNHDLRSFMLYRMIMRRSGALDLTDEQRAKISRMCDEAAPEAFKLIGETRRGRQDKLQRDLRQRIMDEVLTEQQLQIIQKRNRKADGKGAPKPAKPKGDPATRPGTQPAQ